MQTIEAIPPLDLSPEAQTRILTTSQHPFTEPKTAQYVYPTKPFRTNLIRNAIPKYDFGDNARVLKETCRHHLNHYCYRYLTPHNTPCLPHLSCVMDHPLFQDIKREPDLLRLRWKLGDQPFYIHMLFQCASEPNLLDMLVTMFGFDKELTFFEFVMRHTLFIDLCCTVGLVYADRPNLIYSHKPGLDQVICSDHGEVLLWKNHHHETSKFNAEALLNIPPETPVHKYTQLTSK